MSPAPRIEAEQCVELISAGLDIGSATSQLILSRITLAKVGSQYVTVGREVIHQSAIILTPFDGPDRIDAGALGRFVEEQYVAAEIGREAVTTGALILTGVALMRENSRAIAEVFAQDAGKMVAVSAGDGMECVLAAYGSGTVDLSGSLSTNLLNIDIGGGTTKLTVCSGGRVLAHAAVDVGARLVVTDDENRVERIEEAGSRIAQKLHLSLSMGQRFSENDKRKLVTYLVDEVLSASHIDGDGASDLLRTLPLPVHDAAAVCLSGGVAEYIFGRETGQFGDLGMAIATELRSRLEALNIAFVTGNAAGIRATVLGASQHTVQLSGSTIYVSETANLPMRNVPVVAPSFDFEAMSERGVGEAVRCALEGGGLADCDGPVAIAYSWRGLASYSRLKSFCAGIAVGLAVRDVPDSVVVLVGSDDVGRLVGRQLECEHSNGRGVVSIDCVRVGDLDFLDIGEAVPGSTSVPVVIKSLIFPPVVSPAQ